MFARPLCAVVIPVWAFSQGRLAYLDSCLASLVRQSIPTLGIVVDDGSPLAGDVESIVADHGKKGLLRLVRRSKPEGEAKTSAGAVNCGLKLLLDSRSAVLSAHEAASIEGFCYLHSDDLLPGDSIAKRLEALKSHEFATGGFLIMDDRTRKIEPKSGKSGRLSGARLIAHHTIMMSRSFLVGAMDYCMAQFGQSGLFDTTIACEEDRDATLTVSSYAKRTGERGAFLDQFLYYYRKHPESISGIITTGVRLRTRSYLSSKHGIVDRRILRARIRSVIPEEVLNVLRSGRKAVYAKLARPAPRVSVPQEIRDDPLLCGYEWQTGA